MTVISRHDGHGRHSVPSRTSMLDVSQGRAVRDMQRGPDHREGKNKYIYIYIYVYYVCIYIYIYVYMYIGDCWTSQPEHFLTFSPSEARPGTFTANRVYVV